VAGAGEAAQGQKNEQTGDKGKEIAERPAAEHDQGGDQQLVERESERAGGGIDSAAPEFLRGHGGAPGVIITAITKEEERDAEGDPGHEDQPQGKVEL